MGLLSTAAVIAVIAIVITGAALFIFSKVPPGKLTVNQAENLVTSDIKAQNPNANITFISVTNSSLRPDSWQIIISVIYNGSKPCPTMMVDVFNYPVQSLLHPDVIVYSSGNSTGCVVNGYSSAPSYVINSNQIAIARSYSSGNSTIKSYVNRFGYPSTFVTASFLTQNSGLSNETNDWLIRYSATNANYSVMAVLDQSGKILQTYNASK
ncbi:MAG: hypothetical protein KGH94_01580 [Candidatus Micrarchaeota archaeon]|nr:hypothetical protein [Candidatus Micrarchaeota archaeon]